MKREKDWFRIKRYPHIGLPLKQKHRGWIEEYVSDPKNVISHGFYPFIHREISQRKFRRSKNQDGTKSNLRSYSYKIREVFYANHLDSMIYSFYSSLLLKAYEKKLKKLGIQDCVTAYRSIPADPQYGVRNKCNVDFANDIFKYIKASAQKDLVTITFDITSFFDNLNHHKLKKAWAEILDCDNLPEDHYAVFRNLTKFSFVELEDIFEEFKDEIVSDVNGKTKKVKVPRLDLMKEKNALAFCSLKEFESRIRKKGLVKNNKYDWKDGKRVSLREKGIPQGSPISSTLANIYLLHFDKAIDDIVSSLGGIYRRYSDDMIVVVDANHKDIIYNLLITEITKYDLEIQPSKSQVFHFSNNGLRVVCKEENVISGLYTTATKFEYLGFSFDGERVYLKSSGLAKFYRKMKRSIRRGGFYAKYGQGRDKRLFKNRLYNRFTMRGANRRQIVKPALNLPNVFIKTGEHDWGNFLTYAGLAVNVFENHGIKRQIRKSWNKFHELLTDKETDILAHHVRKSRKMH